MKLSKPERVAMKDRVNWLKDWAKVRDYDIGEHRNDYLYVYYSTLRMIYSLKLSHDLLHPAYKISIESDIMNVIGLAENNQKCTAAIMGTGSVAFGWDGKDLHRMGGWGYLFDESGSGYSIGRDIISLALAAEDGLQEKSEAVRLVEAKLDGKPFDFIDVLYSKGTDYIASFAPLAFTAMEAGDKNAEKIIRKAASHVAGLIRETIKKYDVGNSVIISGSVAMNQPSIQKMLSDELNGNISLEIADLPPIFGAMRRCLDLSKIEYDFKSIKQNFVL